MWRPSSTLTTSLLASSSALLLCFGGAAAGEEKVDEVFSAEAPLPPPVEKSLQNQTAQLNLRGLTAVEGGGDCEGCPGYRSWASCQCNSLCTKYGNCCGDYWAKCHAAAPVAPGPDPTPPATPPATPAPQPPAGGYVPTHTPPATPMAYKGMAWPDITVGGYGPLHFFAIGDWGGLDGSLNPPDGRARLIAYSGGHTAGPHVFPRNRWNKEHSELMCTHDQLVECYNTRGHGNECIPACGYVEGIDDQAQILVANAFKHRASQVDPKFIVNVGDNFYWGGIEIDCGHPMGFISSTARHQFNQIFEGIYSGSGLDGKLWLSVLGNHDWGGRVFNNGWDQQIAYTWASSRWVMPAPYWSVHISFKDAGFDMDIFNIDSNVEDAFQPDEDPEHNICGRKHNRAGASCAAAGGPPSVEACPGYFQSLMQEQRVWLEAKMAASRADWQVVNTHFPCGHQADWYRKLRNSGLDLLITGHRHDQELWSNSGMLGGLTCIVTGGGGGISSEATPGHDRSEWYGEAQYGFYDFTVAKDKIFVESINYDGKVVASATVYPH